MKKILFGSVLLITASVMVAQADPRDDVTGAAQKLTQGGNYSWRTTVVVPDNSRFRPGPTEGKVEGNLTDVKMSFRENHTEYIINGTNVAITDPDDGTWERLSDMDTGGAGRFMVGMVKNFKAPAAQAMELAGNVESLQKSGNSYTGTLTEDGAKDLLSFRHNVPVTNPSGTATFWTGDGQLKKFEYHVKGTMTFRGTDRPVDRDVTVEISDVGTTKIDVPADVKKLWGGKS